MGDLAKRLATAAVLVPALLAVIFLDPTRWGVLAFAAVVTVIAHDEVLRMALPVSPDDRAPGLRTLLAALAGAIVALPNVWSPADVLPWVFAGVPVVLGFATLARPQQLEHAGRHYLAAIAALVYVPVPMALLAMLKTLGHPQWLTVTLCTAFFADTFAYGFGRAWGRHRLYPAVSPKKTWEGSVGGVLGSVVATTGVGSLWLLPQLPLSHAIALAVVASVCGQAGDLVESMIKRTFGVKDSGTLLPGHGGMLDRIDALLFVAPVVYAYVVLVWAGAWT
jgi:phosphatidate cytidylyltransferase